MIKTFNFFFKYHVSNIKFLSYIIVRTHENCFRRLVLFKDSYPWTKAGSRPEVCEHVTCKLFMEICPKIAEDFTLWIARLTSQSLQTKDFQAFESFHTFSSE